MDNNRTDSPQGRGPAQTWMNVRYGMETKEQLN